MTTPISAVYHADTPSTAWLRDASAPAGDGPQLQPDGRLAVEEAQADHAPILRIRSLQLRDLKALDGLPGTLRLDVPDSLLLRRGELLDLSAAVPVLRRDRPTFVATADQHPVGFARFSPREPDRRWVLASIAASTGVYSPDPVWEALLAHGVRAAGLRGVRRLFARVPVGHPLIDAMRRGGWTPYARETVFRTDRIVPRGRPSKGLRQQEPADTWAIHQLYAHSVPRHIQEIEAITSQYWHVDRQRRPHRGVRRSGLVADEGGTIAAYARYSRGAKASMIELVVPPGDHEHFGGLLDAIAVASSRARPIYCALRTDLQDLNDDLRNRGFVEVGEQELLIRYTTASARTPVLDPVHFPVELRPALPRRVPTFLEGQPTDGTI